MAVPGGYNLQAVPSHVFDKYFGSTIIRNCARFCKHSYEQDNQRIELTNLAYSTGLKVP